MTSPTTMRLMGLLVIVGMVAGCGDDLTVSGGAAVVAGRYRLDAEKTFERAVEMALVHDADWNAAKTEEERARARQALVDLQRRAIEFRSQGTLTLRTDGTFQAQIGESESLDDDLPRMNAGTWEARGSEVTFVTTHEDGQTMEVPFKTWWRFSADSLYMHPDSVRRVHQATHTGAFSEVGRAVIPPITPVMTKE